MDFGTLLQTAKQNENSKKEVRSYSTKFAPPKKENKKDKILSANIQKFLARKESEEKRKSIEATKKRDELLALRSKDKKATRRVNVMLKRTKSANQSVIDDAVDNDNTAVTLAGPAQPDEDDYGYVSQEASAFYNKMMEKYNTMPEEQKYPDAKKRASSNLMSTKDRVKAALEREKLEAMMPHKRKRKHKEGDEQEHHDDDEEDRKDGGGVKLDVKSEPPQKQKPKFKAPPPINFTDLLKLASQKQHEPIMIEVKPKDEGPLFTKKQKYEFEKEQQRRGGEGNTKLSVDQINEIRKLPPSHLYRTKKREISRPEIHEDANDSDEDTKPQSSKLQNRPSNDQMLIQSRDKTGINRKDVPKVAQDNRIPKKQGDIIPNGVRPSKSYTDKLPCDITPNKRDAVRLTESGAGNYSKTTKIQAEKPLLKSNTKQPLDNRPKVTSDRTQIDKNRPSFSKNVPSNNNHLKPSQSAFKKPEVPAKQSDSLKVQGRVDVPHKSVLDKNRINKSNDLGKSIPVDRNRQPLSKDSKIKQFPPPDVVRRKEMMKPKPQINKRRIVDDDDEEYDSEMDDFIDDGPEESNDYSNYIREIFGYDKRKYRVNDEDDVDDMESSFAQQMREDVRSAKLGLMEDLEDIQREKEEKRRKALRKKGRL